MCQHGRGWPFRFLTWETSSAFCSNGFKGGLGGLRYKKDDYWFGAKSPTRQHGHLLSICTHLVPGLVFFPADNLGIVTGAAGPETKLFYG